MKDTFQIIILVVFIGLLMLGVLLFAGVIGPKPGSDSSSKVVGTATIWGTLPQTEFNNIAQRIYAGKDYSVRYIQKSEATYRESLLEAFSSGTGPDLFLVTDQDVFSFESKLVPFPYDQFWRDFKNTFVTEGEIFAGSTGYNAIPLLIDPLVMYWNRGIFDANGTSKAPSTWKEVLDLTPTLTKKTDSGTISQSAISMGFMDNILHKRSILSLIFFQQGSSVSRRADFTVEPVFQVADANSQISPAENGLDFMVQFVDPLSPYYTWNRALNTDKERFTSSQLAMYLGTASELFEIQEKNPNLNFDVASVPQIDNQSRVTYGKIYGIALSKFTQNSKVAYQAVYDLVSPTFQTELSSVYSLPPVRRDLLTQRPENPYAAVFFDSSLSARAWLDPSTKKTNSIWQSMFDAVFSNSLDTRAAVSRAASEFSLAGFPQ